MNDAQWKSHLGGVGGEIKDLTERADALERIASNLTDPEAKAKAERLVHLYRLHAEKLTEHISDDGSNHS
jgi:hypothetical protein